MNKTQRHKFNFINTFFVSLFGVGLMFNFSYANNQNQTVDKDLLSKTTTNMIYDTINESEKCTCKSSEKIAYITIDDGPSRYTNEILNVLNKYDARATFFMIDKNMKSHPNEVKCIIENGNTPGFHSVSHDIHQLYKTDKSAKEEFDINKQTLLDLTGVESNIVRLPYGSKPYASYECYENLVEAGYKMWDWDIDTQDWKVDSDKVLENVITYSKGKDNIVVLMHERKQTAKNLESILKYLKSEGYTFLPIEEDEMPQNYWIKNLNK